MTFQLPTHSNHHIDHSAGGRGAHPALTSSSSSPTRPLRRLLATRPHVGATKPSFSTALCTLCTSLRRLLCSLYISSASKEARPSSFLRSFVCLFVSLFILFLFGPRRPPCLSFVSFFLFCFDVSVRAFVGWLVCGGCACETDGGDGRSEGPSRPCQNRGAFEESSSPLFASVHVIRRLLVPSERCQAHALDTHL